MQYLILSDSTSDGMALWWRPDRCGYTTDLQRAGRYSKEEAESIQRIRGTDFPVPESAIGTILQARLVVNIEDSNNVDELRKYRWQPMQPSPTSGDSNG